MIPPPLGPSCDALGSILGHAKGTRDSYSRNDRAINLLCRSPAHLNAYVCSSELENRTLQINHMVTLV